MNQSNNWVAMGYIKGAFGIKGWVKVHADTEFADSLLDYKQWQLRQGTQTMQMNVSEGHIANGELQVKFTTINDRDSAASLRGYTIEIARNEFAQTDEDEFYWTDLVGMTVLNQENIVLGTVHNLMATGAHDILVINGEFGQKLIPFVAQFIMGVNPETRQISVDWGVDY